MILDDIVEKRRIQLENEKKNISLDDMIALAKNSREPKGFRDALTGEKMAVIAEVKKASPSKGIIKEDFEPVAIAKQYEKAGANVISVLTEEYYFKGSSEYLRQIRQEVNLPILRKDFIIDKYQIYEARAIGADAILLIVAVLPMDTIKEFMAIAKSIGLECLVEVHNKEELDIATICGADIIGINNRNLKTFDVSLDITKNLIKDLSKDYIIVSESGIKTNDDMKILKSYGAKAVLVGETLMRSENIGEELKKLRAGV